MPASLVFGASGAVGQFLLPLLAARGERVVALSRKPPPAVQSPGQIQWLRGDLFGDMPTLPPLETIYSLGPLDAFVDWFVRCVPAGARRVIAFSSMSAESKQDSPDPAERALALRLRAAEARLLQAAQAGAVACTIFRPTLIYGSGRDRSLAPLARFARRWRVLPIPRGADGLRQPVHAADLADACIAARDVAATFGQTYALGGGERLRFDALLARIAAGPPRIALAVPVPLALLRAGLRLARSGDVIGAGALARLRVALIADNMPATDDFGYAPRIFASLDVLGESAAEPATRDRI
ncbi:MAG: SDR family oxidoreductase [Rudaea sp.]